MVTFPSQYVVMGWHQNRSAAQACEPGPGGDGWYRPEAWHRPEFREGDGARVARDLLDSYLADSPVALAHIGYLVDLYARPAGRAAGRAADLASEAGVRAVTAVATWLDEALYGQGREQFPKGERYPLQVTADSMARGDFCRMNFRELVADCLARGVSPAPISPGRVGRPV
jgi:hypothetical protein